MPADERAAIARRLRLEWACQGDAEHVAAVERMIATGSPRRFELALEPA